jgi:serine protease Do
VTRALLAAAAGVVLAACATAVPPRGDRGEIIRHAVASTVQLRAEREGGVRRAASGVAVAADVAAGATWVLTTRHFLDPPGPQRLWAIAPGEGRRLRAQVAALSDEADLALLEVRGLALAPVALRDTARLGDGVWVVAFPWGRRLTIASGVVSQIWSERDDTPFDGPARMVDASVSYGSSGGGVYDASDGSLVGIVEGYRTARVAIQETPPRALDIPVAGETTLIPAVAIRRFLIAAGWMAPLP